jgi:prepilin-type N-terminal cleavage/methylation domain-containing protein
MKLKTGEKGFTLVEMVLVIALMALVVGAATAAIVTIFKVAPQTNNLAIALRQVQNAGYWITQDVTIAENITIVGQLPSLKLDVWNDATQTFTTHSVTYVFNGQTLRRQLDGVTPGTLIAESIDTVHTKFETIVANGEYKLTVAAPVSGSTTSITRVYEIHPRLGVTTQ